MKPSLNLRQIEAFRCVMVSGSMVGAARLMNVTQPGVSRTISLMELRLGYRLFERRGRRVVGFLCFRGMCGVEQAGRIPESRPAKEDQGEVQSGRSFGARAH